MNRLLERFLRYVKIDTESVPDVQRYPSSEKQKNLLALLRDELVQMGISATMDEKYGYVYATIPKNVKGNYKLGFIAHVDTSSAVSGKDVKPIVTADYDGQDITLAEGRRLSPAEFGSLLKHVGKTIISSDGTTLLGADDKAGVAVIMELANILAENPSVAHGEVKIAFTPDEEVGRGTDFFDIGRFGADGAYTVDGGGLGELEYENFNAASAKVSVRGKSVHPGSAKGVMVNANLVLMELQSMLPVFENPMYTEGYEGFFHLDSMHGECDCATANYIIRDHDREKFQRKKQLFADVVDFLNKKYGEGTVTAEITDSYYNMKEKILPHIHLVENACRAMEKAGVTPVVCPIRGGTDGARLSYEGLPCPNLFTGGYNFHGRYEYIPLEDMQKALDVALNLVDIYKDR
ncbi:MAG TPA: peptidase T [Candidatus Fimimonas gallinarum]|uniref:Peptidase T n=1 Tax=Candidatus Fimimonas gallinarum TaxID=2840821 RepID=A0A9D1E3A1_9BACT|nr:peptidase T [Candidatus Fimimonas gallinarum]